MAAMFKTVKSPYLCHRLTDFDEIWQSPAPDNLIWRTAAILRVEKVLKYIFLITHRHTAQF